MYDIFEQLLQERGITSYKVSKDTGVTQSTLSDWKRGRSTPKTDNMKKIADYFGVTIDYLMTGEDDSDKTSEYWEDFLIRYKQRQKDLNIDNEDRHFLLIHHYDNLDRIGRDSLLEILASLKSLNELGQKEASKRVSELTEMNKYTE